MKRKDIPSHLGLSWIHILDSSANPKHKARKGEFRYPINMSIFYAKQKLKLLFNSKRPLL